MTSHHDWAENIIAGHDAIRPFAPENGKPLKFKIGDRVIHTNDYGVSFHHRIAGLYRPDAANSLYASGHRYMLDRDCHWMPVKEAALAFDTDPIAVDPD